jgi:hypothetical protein
VPFRSFRGPTAGSGAARCRAGHDGDDVGAVALGGEPPDGGRPTGHGQRLRGRRVVEDLADPTGEGVRVVRGNEQPRLAGRDDLPQSLNGRRDDGAAGQLPSTAALPNGSVRDGTRTTSARASTGQVGEV